MINVRSNILQDRTNGHFKVWRIHIQNYCQTTLNSDDASLFHAHLEDKTKLGDGQKVLEELAKLHQNMLANFIGQDESCGPTTSEYFSQPYWPRCKCGHTTLKNVSQLRGPNERCGQSSLGQKCHRRTRLVFPTKQNK